MTKQAEVDVIGLQHYHAFYMDRRTLSSPSGGEGNNDSLLVCLVLKQDRKVGSRTGLVCSARIYFNGAMVQSPMMINVLKAEAIQCAHGFPCSTSALTMEQTGSFAATRKARHTPATLQAVPAATVCKVTLGASVLRHALLNFMTGEEHDLVCDQWNTKGNGLGFRAVHHEVGCVGLLYLMRDDVMLMEQPLFETVAVGTANHTPPFGGCSDSVGPSHSLFLLNVTVMQTFLGLTSDEGSVDLTLRECHATGEQRGTLSYHRVISGAAPEREPPVFTASFLLVPTGT